MIKKDGKGIRFQLKDAHEMAIILETAAAVTRNAGEDCTHIEKWKYTCGKNLKAIGDINDKAMKEVEAILAMSDSPDWSECADAMRNIAGDVGLNLKDADTGASLIVYGVDAMLKTETFCEAERIAMDDFIKAFSELPNQNLARAAVARVESLEEAGKYLDGEVYAEIRRIDFKEVPERLHGGFMVELEWMFTGVPSELEGESQKAEG